MSALKERLAGVGLLALGFVVFSSLVAGGRFDQADRTAARAVAGLYQESLHPLFRALAVLGGIELTSLVVLGLGTYLWRRGHRDAIWALASFPVAAFVEVLYKKLLHHPGPAAGHSDGPSLSSLLEGVAAGNSYPSGHAARVLVAYGLLAFVIHRLGSSRAAALAPIGAAIIIAAVAATRLYLGVHWASDVVGGMLLGGIALLGSMIWLDRPRPEGG